jgi:hypothetical protein
MLKTCVLKFKVIDVTFHTTVVVASTLQLINSILQFNFLFVELISFAGYITVEHDVQWKLLRTVEQMNPFNL